MEPHPFPSSEYELISRMRSVLRDRPNPYYYLGIGDDAAIRREDESNQLAITADISVENVHFSLSYMTMEEAGYRAMVANLSDCAAMGACPDSALVQLVVPGTGNDILRQVEELYRGFRDACTRWNFSIVGGDISRGAQWVIGITMLGRIPREKHVLRRTGMRPGDKLWVTGAPGRSAAGLCLLQSGERGKIPEKYRELVMQHIRPVPRIEIGASLSENPHVHAVMDLSDGLSKDCRTLSHENGCGIILKAIPSQLPEAMLELSRETAIPWRQWFFHGGEDYELLVAASAGFDGSGFMSAKDGGIPLCIGECTDAMREVMVREDGELVPLSGGGYDHLGVLQ